MNINYKKNKLKLCLLINLEKKYSIDVIDYLKKRYDLFIITSEKKSNLKKIKSMKFDIIVSYIYPFIIPKKILDKTKFFNINFHPGPPEYPGIGCFNFALFNEENKYGVTAHHMVPEVDTGQIIKVKYFKINKNITVDDLSIKTYKCLLKLLKEVFQSLLKTERLEKSSYKWLKKPYTRKELNNLSKLNKNMKKKQFLKVIRCTYYKGKPPPFIIIHGKKFIYEE